MSFHSQIDLWFYPLKTLDNSESTIAYLRSWLSEAELEKVARYRLQSRQLEALYVRACLRFVLSQYASLKPAEWKFEHGSKGKPRLESALQTKFKLLFNLSHSGEHLVIAVTKAESGAICLGVDVECLRADTDIDSILNHYFSRQEASALKQLPLNQQRERFFDLWVLKEAYIKAVGQGLARSLKSFGFDFSSASKHQLASLSDEKQPLGSSLFSAPILYRAIPLLRGEGNSEQWQCCLGHLDSQYRFAVALGGGSGDVNLNASWLSQSQLVQDKPSD